LSEARAVLFLVAGADKARALARALGAESEPAAPAALVHPRDGSLTWLVTRAAAAELAPE